MSYTATLTTPQVPVYYLGQEAQVSWFYWNSDTSPTWRRFRQVNLSLASTWVIPSGDFKCSVSQSCPTFCDSMDCSLPGFYVHGIFQARILEWVAFSRGSSQPRNQTQVSYIAGRFFTIWAASIRSYIYDLIYVWYMISYIYDTYRILPSELPGKPI